MQKPIFVFLTLFNPLTREKIMRPYEVVARNKTRGEPLLRLVDLASEKGEWLTEKFVRAHAQMPFKTSSLPFLDW